MLEQERPRKILLAQKSTVTPQQVGSRVYTAGHLLAIYIVLIDYLDSGLDCGLKFGLELAPWLTTISNLTKPYINMYRFSTTCMVEKNDYHNYDNTLYDINNNEVNKMTVFTH